MNMQNLQGKNPELYKKLEEEFKVSPLVLESDCYRVIDSCFCKDRFAAFMNFLLCQKFTRHNIETIKFILKNPCVYGYIFMDKDENRGFYESTFVHEFIHSFQKMNGSFVRDIHDFRELEADTTSVDFLIRNNINVMEQFKIMKEQFNEEGEGFIALIKELVPVIRMVAILLFSFEIVVTIFK